MIRILIYAVIFYVIIYALKGLFGGISRQMSGARGGARGAAVEALDDEMIVCPECETYFPSGIGLSRRVRRERFRFCGEECAGKFSLRGGPPSEDESKGEG